MSTTTMRKSWRVVSAAPHALEDALRSLAEDGYDVHGIFLEGGQVGAVAVGSELVAAPRPPASYRVVAWRWSEVAG